MSSNQAAGKGPSAETRLRWVPARFRGPGAYAPIGMGTRVRLGPTAFAAGYPPKGRVSWTFLRGLGGNDFFRTLRERS